MTTALSDDIVALWQITQNEQIADTNSSRVYRCSSALYPNSVIVKDLKPIGLWEAKGFDFLEWRQGVGGVRLLDRIGNVGLLEDAGTVSLSQYHTDFGDLAASSVFVDVVKQLHSAGNADIPPALISMRDHFDSLFQTAETIENSFLGENLRWAAKLADHLIATQSATRPLHGDIHHENIVSSDRQRWKAIDPQGLIGDPAYDVANVFGNPLKSPDLVLNVDRINALATLFADGLQMPRERIVKFAGVHAGVSICWSLRDSGALETNVEMNERFELMHLLRTLIES